MRATHLLFLIAILLSQVLCETFYLSQNGSDEDGDGSPEKPYQTLYKVLNSTDDPTDSLVINVYPGIYGGPQNVGLNYTGALTINWYQNSSAADGDATAVQFDCTNATATPCIFSNTSITVNGLDNNENPQVSFEDCSTCLAVDNTEHSDDINDDYVINIYGVTFTEVSQSAVTGLYLKSVEVSDSLFSDGQAGGLTLLSLINVDDEIKIQNTNFTTMNKNALSIVNTTKTEVEDCTFTNALIAISGLDDDSQVVLGPNTHTSNTAAAQYIITLSTGTFTVKDSKLNTNGAGSVKVTNGVTASIINSTFEQGAALNGAALYFENVTTVTVSDGSYFASNIATVYGGAIYLANSEVHLDASNFTLNTARNGAAIACAGNETVNYDNTTVFFYQNTNTDVNGTDIQNTCNVEIQTFQSSLVVSSIDSSSTWWIWLLVSIAVLIVILIIVAAVGFVVWQRKRQSYTRMD